jgi:hypothetical protein
MYPLLNPKMMCSVLASLLRNSECFEIVVLTCLLYVHGVTEKHQVGIKMGKHSNKHTQN